MSGEPPRQRHVYVLQPKTNKPKPTSSKSGRKKPDVVSTLKLLPIAKWTDPYKVAHKCHPPFRLGGNFNIV